MTEVENSNPRAILFLLMLTYRKCRRRTCTPLIQCSIWLSVLRSSLFAYCLCYLVGHLEFLFIGL